MSSVGSTSRRPDIDWIHVIEGGGGQISRHYYPIAQQRYGAKLVLHCDGWRHWVEHDCWDPEFALSSLSC